ncbi:MAG: hypothetical protein ACTSWP_07615 [Candidatus Freyarchaeota archaeon]|nr:hypothetical protein [Candidatus Freyrarchaeum guaymaensis]
MGGSNPTGGGVLLAGEGCAAKPPSSHSVTGHSTKPPMRGWRPRVSWVMAEMDDAPRATGRGRLVTYRKK